jgi:hypothetical protein
MTNRREAVQACLLGAAAPLAAVSGSGAAAEPAIWRAVYDERFEPGRTFVRDAAARGWTARAIRGDVTELWYRELEPQWRQGPAAIAGVTTADALFCLEMLARDRGLRLAARSELEGGLVAWLIAPKPGRRP